MLKRDYIAQLIVGTSYDRPTLAQLWGLGGHQAISRGVYTPSCGGLIFLFVTREKQACLTQYKDFLDGDLLFWEGEKQHSSDRRIIEASTRGEEIHLFYRERHHCAFVYHGRVVVVQGIQHGDRPSEFVFKVAALTYELPSEERARVAESGADYEPVSISALNGIDRQVVATTRGMAQHIFRGNLLKMWQGTCAVTGVCEERILRASHIKPWAKSTPDEKMDRHNGLLLIPDLDALFEEGLITFEYDGAMLMSPDLAGDDRAKLHICKGSHLRQVTSEMQPYLEYHREKKFIA